MVSPRKENDMQLSTSQYYHEYDKNDMGNNGEHDENIMAEKGEYDENAVGEEGECESDSSDSNYEQEESSSEDDDRLYEKFVENKGKGKMVEPIGDSSSSDMEDGVDDDYDDFDEAKLSDGEKVGHNFPSFNPQTIFKPHFEGGHIFSTKAEFKKAVQSIAINQRRNVHFPKSDKDRCYAQCRAKACEWRMHINKIQGEASWQLRVYQPNHSCPEVKNVKNVKTKWLTERFLPLFKSDPKRSVKGFRLDAIRELGYVNVSKDQAYRAKRGALKVLGGNPDDQYNKLWEYAGELRRSNPGSTILLGQDDEGKFRNFYVCFKALKDGFNAGCRPILGVDGCFLKGPYGGMLLAAIAVDPNNQWYPVAYAVVPNECTETWGWFLIILKKNLGMTRTYEYTFISDKQKGLIKAVEEVFPDAQHRFCVRHLQGNFGVAGFKGLAYKNALWAAARASTENEWKIKMDDMRALGKEAADWFNDKSPKQWSKSHFSLDPKCDMLLNNCCESFNATILEARDKPIITMLEWIREYLMTRLQEGRDKAAKNWKNRLCPRINKIVDKHIERVRDCIALKCDDTNYQVACCDGTQFNINLQKKSCTCRKWQLSGIPCKHAIAAIYDQGELPHDYVDDCYTVDLYKKIYQYPILGINGVGEWAATLYIPPLPPKFGRGVGRPKKARRRETEEPPKSKRARKTFKMGKRQNSVKCSKCGIRGHNAKGCKVADVKVTGDATIQQDLHTLVNEIINEEQTEPTHENGNSPIIPIEITEATGVGAVEKLRPKRKRAKNVSSMDAQATPQEISTQLEEIDLTQHTQPSQVMSQERVLGPSMWDQLHMTGNTLQKEGSN